MRWDAIELALTLILTLGLEGARCFWCELLLQERYMQSELFHSASFTWRCLSNKGQK
jgi:hypothetical protein